MKKIITLFLLSIAFLSVKSQSVVISQVYGGGGNSGSVYTNDFIELFNPTGAPINLNGWSVQYNSATGSGAWQVTNLTNFTLQPGQYYLVQEAVGTGGTTPLPTADAVGAIAMSGTAGKVAVVNSTTALSACPAASAYLDLVGFGSTANCFEGTGPTTAPSNSNSVIRGNNGCLDNNQNATDFTSVVAAPRNSATAVAPCGVVNPSMSVTGTISDFGNVVILTNSTSQSFNLSGANLTGAPGNITITAPSTDFQVSNNNSTWGPTTTIAYSSATLASTAVYVRFSPQTTGFKSGNVTVSGGGVTSPPTVAVSGTGVNPSPSLSTTGTPLSDFGSVVILNNSSSQSFSLSGANLTGAPGNITITAPSTDFQVSNNNSTWGPTTTIAYATATLASTLVYVRFTPQTAGAKSGNVTMSGGGVSSPPTVAVSGTGVLAPVPSLTVTSLAAFGSVCTNTTAGPNSFTINGTNLTTANVTVGPFTGYTFSTTAGGTYTASLSLTQGGGTYTQQVFVKFTPTAVASYSGNIPVAGGGSPTTTNVPVSGSGVNSTPTVVTGVSSAVTSTAATLAGTISANGCTTPTAYGIEYSTTAGFANGTGTQVPSTNISGGNYTSNLTGLAPGTTYYYKAYATNGGGTAWGTQLQFTTATPGLVGSALTSFGSVCLNTTGGPNSFTITGTNLTTANVTVGPLAGYTFSTTSGGTYTNSLTITQPGGAFSQQVFVKFTPTASGSANGNIPVSGGGAVTANVPVTGTGANTAPAVTTGTAAVLTPNNVTLNGIVSNIGCSPVTVSGIEYSGITGFANGHGTKINAANLSAGNFSVTATGLVQGATYYYKAFAVNNGGISYGAEQTFTMSSLPTKFTIYSTPIQRGGTVRFSLTGIKPGHYAAQVLNSAGQLVFQKDMILTVTFIDDSFVLPGNIGTGMYSLQIANVDGVMGKKAFLVQ